MCYPHKTFKEFEIYTEDVPDCIYQRSSQSESIYEYSTNCCFENFLEKFRKSVALNWTFENFGTIQDIGKYNVPAYLRASYLAKKFKIYIIINLADRKLCTSEQILKGQCPKTGAFQYNTDIALDKNGCIVAKHYKLHLLNEFQFNAPLYPNHSLSVFDTEFGRMGLVICMDLLCKNPSIDLIEQYNIDTILMSTAWGDSFSVFFLGYRWHSGFAARMGVNLLVSNLFLDRELMSGSGIYTPTLIAGFTKQKTSEEERLVIAKILSKPKKKKIFDVQTYNASCLLSNSDGRSNVIRIPFYNKRACYQVCAKSLCCKFKYELEKLDENRITHSNSTIDLFMRITIVHGIMNFANSSATDYEFEWQSCSFRYEFEHKNLPESNIYSYEEGDVRSDYDIGMVHARDSHRFDDIPLDKKFPYKFAYFELESNLQGYYIFPQADIISENSIIPGVQLIKFSKSSSQKSIISYDDSSKPQKFTYLALVSRLFDLDKPQPLSSRITIPLEEPWKASGTCPEEVMYTSTLHNANRSGNPKVKRNGTNNLNKSGFSFFFIALSLIFVFFLHDSQIYFLILLLT